MTGQLAFVESPVQLLNVLEWAHTQAVATGAASLAPAGAPGSTDAGASVRAIPSTDAAQGGAHAAPALTVVVLSPTDPMSRGPRGPGGPRGPAAGRTRHRAGGPRGPGGGGRPPRGF